MSECEDVPDSAGEELNHVLSSLTKGHMHYNDLVSAQIEVAYQFVSTALRTL